MKYLVKLWHRFTLGRTARPAGLIRSIEVEYNSNSRPSHSFPGLAYKLDFLPTAMMVVGQDAYLARRKATDLPPGVVRIVLETSE